MTGRYDEPYGGRSKRKDLEIVMQRQGPGAGTDGDRSNPWTVLRKEEKFTCSYFSVRSDTVQFGAALPRAYNSIRSMTKAAQLWLGNTVTFSTASLGNFQPVGADWIRRRWKQQKSN